MTQPLKKSIGRESSCLICSALHQTLSAWLSVQNSSNMEGVVDSHHGQKQVVDVRGWRETPGANWWQSRQGPPRHLNRGGVKKEKSEEHNKEETEAANRWINHGFWERKLQPENQDGKVRTNAVSKAKPTQTKPKERQHALNSLRDNELRGRNKMNNNFTG